MPVLDAQGKQQPLVSVHEASTYENAQNLSPDFIQTLEATYRGKMRARYLMGAWVAFEGVIYDDFDDNVHVVPKRYMLNHLQSIRMQGYELLPYEGYDFGITEPSAYLLALHDPDGNTYIVDGFYERELGISEQARKMRELRAEYAPPDVQTNEMVVHADPQTAKRTNAGVTGVGKSVLAMFADHGVWMAPSNNNVMAGIAKVKEALYPRQHTLNPFTGAYGAPSLYVADTLTWFLEEMAMYRWKRGVHDDVPTDKPVEVNNHAMDALRYMLMADPPKPRRVRARPLPVTERVRKWYDVDDTSSANSREHRYSA